MFLFTFPHSSSNKGNEGSILPTGANPISQYRVPHGVVRASPALHRKWHEKGGFCGPRSGFHFQVRRIVSVSLDYMTN
jgi:hypothetical protein